MHEFGVFCVDVRRCELRKICCLVRYFQMGKALFIRKRPTIEDVHVGVGSSFSRPQFQAHINPDAKKKNECWARKKPKSTMPPCKILCVPQDEPLKNTMLHLFLFLFFLSLIFTGFTPIVCHRASGFRTRLRLFRLTDLLLLFPPIVVAPVVLAPGSYST